jgi:hypothetical protein
MGNLNIAELTAMTIQSRDPWLSCGLCCPTGSSLIMVSSETLDPLYCLIFFVQQVFVLHPHMDWYRELPQFALHIFSIVPYPVPRRSKRLHLTVASPFTLAFALFGQAQLTHPKHTGSSLGRLTRLQISLYATARWIACPSPARTFTFELSSLESPHSNVEYNYTDTQSISVTGLSPVRYAALWAATELVGSGI